MAAAILDIRMEVYLGAGEDVVEEEENVQMEGVEAEGSAEL